MDKELPHKKFPGNERHPTGTIIHWTERDPANPNHIAITCHKCKRKSFVWRTVVYRPEWYGLCRSCAKERGSPKKRTRDQELASGSIIHWGEPAPPGQSWVTCGECGRKRLTHARHGKLQLSWTGFCRECGDKKHKPWKHTRDENLPTGSIIHYTRPDPDRPGYYLITCGKCLRQRFARRGNNKTWTGYCVKCVHRLDIRDDETLPTGSIIYWKERDPEDGRKRLVECGKCHRKRFTIVHGGKSRQNFTGFCFECHIKKHYGKEVLPDGIIDWEDKDPADSTRVAVTCLRCGQKRYTRAPYSGRKRGWTGLCVSCSQMKYTSDEVLPSRAVVRRGERDPTDRRKVAVTCPQCKQKSFVFPQGRPTWSGLCSNCVKERGSPKRLTEDEPLSSGSIIRWSVRSPDGKKVLVKCGTCGEERWMLIGSAFTLRSALTRRKKNWAGYCLKHYRDPGLIRDLFIAHTGKNESGDNREQRRKRGRKAGAQLFDRAQFLEDVEKTILNLWDTHHSFEQIREKTVASILNLGSEETGADILRKRLRECGVKKPWDHYKVEVVAKNRNLIPGIKSRVHSEKNVVM